MARATYTIIWETSAPNFEVSASSIKDAIALAEEQTGLSRDRITQIWMPNPDDPYNPDDRVCLTGAALDLYI